MSVTARTSIWGETETAAALVDENGRILQALRIATGVAGGAADHRACERSGGQRRYVIDGLPELAGRPVRTGRFVYPLLCPSVSDLQNDLFDCQNQVFLTGDVKALQGRAGRNRNIRAGHPSQRRF